MEESYGPLLVLSLLGMTAFAVLNVVTLYAWKLTQRETNAALRDYFTSVDELKAAYADLFRAQNMLISALGGRPAPETVLPEHSGIDD